MQISKINIENYLGIKSLELNNEKKVLLIAGHNGAGKSSLAEAIRHALLGDFSRVSYKKDLHNLIHDGGDAGHVILNTNLGEYAALLPDGKVTGDHSALDGALKYCLSPELFAQASSDERRAFLFKLMGVQINSSAIADRMLAAGVDVDLVEEIKPHLIDGFVGGHEYAVNQARDFKIAWRTTTGETYGEKKAEGWKKPIPDAPATIIDQDEIKLADITIEGIVSRIAELKSQRLGATMGAEALIKHKQKIEALREDGSKYARIQHKLNKDEDDLAQWERKIAVLMASASSQGDPMPCPHCGGMVALSTHEPILEIAKDHVADPDHEKTLLEYTKARDLMKSAVENGKRDLAAADNAARQLAELEAQPMAEIVEVEVFDQEISQLEKTLQTKRSERDALRYEYQKQQQALLAVDESAAITAKAAGYHQKVVMWLEAADHLSPDGIQAQMLSEAMEPFNKLLTMLSNESGWQKVELDEQINVLVGGLPYSLRSESEKWRADALLSAAIAELSGVRMIMIDRFDVLDLEGRNQLFTWLSKADLEMAIALGTMKAPVINMPDFINFVWM